MKDKEHPMDIAIAVDGDVIGSQVSEQFERCKSMLIVNAESMEVTVIHNSDVTEDLAGEQLAQKVLDHDCEAVITGLIRSVAFELLAGAGETRFLGTKHDGAMALVFMHANKLELIRDADGGDSCGGSHHH
jgi:predicted Fe-Mo cluster-binding NifX family protein